MGELTEKKLKNKRFHKTEEAIIMAFSLIKDYSSTKRFVKVAQISRSTLYRHHKTISQIIPDYEEYIFKKYKKVIQKLLKNKNITLRHLYQRTLIFIVANKKIAQFLYQFGNHSTLEKMIFLLQPKIIAAHRISNYSMFRIYIKEVIEVIEQWENNGFKIDEISPTIGKIMYLTNTARDRLGPISSQK